MTREELQILIDDKNSRINKLSQELKEKKKELNAAPSIIKQKEAIIKSLTIKKDNAEKHIVSLFVEKKNLEQKKKSVETVDSKIDGFLSLIEVQKEEILKCKKEITAQHQKQFEIKQELDFLEKSIVDLKQTKKNVENNLKALDNKKIEKPIETPQLNTSENLSDNQKNDIENKKIQLKQLILNVKACEKEHKENIKKKDIINELHSGGAWDKAEDELYEFRQELKKEGILSLVEIKEEEEAVSKNSEEIQNISKKDNKNLDKIEKNKVSPEIPAQNMYKKAEVSPSLLGRLKKTITGLLNAVSDFVTNIFKSDTDAEAKRPLLEENDDSKKVKNNDITNESTKDIFTATASNKMIENENQKKSSPSNGEEYTVWGNFFPQSTVESDVQQEMTVNANKGTSPKIGQK